MTQLPQMGLTANSIDDEEALEMGSDLPPFEPLVLWVDDEDSLKKVEVNNYIQQIRNCYMTS